MFNLKKIVSAAIAGAMIFSTLPMAYATTDPVLLSEDFEASDIADRVGTGTDKEIQVTRVCDPSSSNGYFEFGSEDDNQYLVLKDLYSDYYTPSEGATPIDYHHLNTVAMYNANTNLTGTFAVETKFQIPELRDGARFYPITGFYTEADLTAGNWNRGHLARFVYVEKDGDNFVFKYSDHVPADTAETTEVNSGAVITDAKAGKWYTLRLNFDIDGDAETVDTFRYELTDGTEVYSGNGGAVGNGAGHGAWSAYTPDYNLTALHKVAFGYVWDETTAEPDDPTTMYIDDLSIRNVSDATPITLTSSTPAVNAEDFDVDAAIELTFSGDITEASAQNIKLTPAVDATITADGNIVTITPDEDLPYETTYTVTIPNTLVNTDGAEVISSSFKFTTEKDPDTILFEDFEGANVASKIGTANTRATDYTVTRVSDFYGGSSWAIETEASGNKFLKLIDKEGNGAGRCNVAMDYETNKNLTGRFSVSTKFQIPALVEGAKYYPITAFYDDADRIPTNGGGWNRGELARFVYVQGGEFKVSTGVPADTTVTSVIDNGTTIATAEAGKWYTLKLNFNIDGDANTIDTFSYELTDGTNNYAGNGGAVGNKCGYQSIITDCDFNLTSLYQLVFGYIWDETAATETVDNNIYIDDISVRRTYEPITLVSSDPEANATNVALDKTITLTFSEAVTNASAQNITITPAVDAAIVASGTTVTINPTEDLAYGTYTVTIPSTVANEAGRTVTATSFKFTTIEDPDLIISEDFEGDIADRMSTDRTLDFTVSRVNDLGDFANHFAIKTEAGNKFIELKDIYGHEVEWQGNMYDYGRYNVALEYNADMNLDGTFAVETKFQIPRLVEGAKYYPITGFYNETDLTGTATSGWNRGKLARFVYAVKEGDNFVFKYSNYVPADINETEEASDDVVIGTAEAGKWYTLKLILSIDGDATTIDRFTYELTDGTNTYSGLGGAIGNGVGTANYPYDPHYNLTSLYKLAFGYIWDETVETETTPDTIYLDDISVRLTDEEIEIPEEDTNLIMSEDFQSENVASKIGTTSTRATDYTVTRVSDFSGTSSWAIETEASGNKFLKLIDKEGNGAGRCNVAMDYEANKNFTGTFAVETKFQIPTLVEGAKYYPITAFYDDADRVPTNNGGWNRGELARFVYVQGGEFRVSTGVPADTTVTSVIDNGTTIATAEAGKWYTLKLIFNIDGDAETIDTFTYELTDGTNNYAGNGGAVGNKCGYQSIITDCDFNLTSLYQLVFGYIWDETAATETVDNNIYIDDISIRKVVLPITMTGSDPAANATDVAIDKSITLTFSEAVTEASAQNITISPAVEKTISVSGNTVTIDPTANLAYNTSYTVTVPETVANADGKPVAATSFTFTTVEEGQEVDPDVILSENFNNADISISDRNSKFTVTRVDTLTGETAKYSIETDDLTGNKFLKLNDIYGKNQGGDVGRCNVALEYNENINLTGRFSVSTKFQIPSLVSGAKYYPITGFYDEANLSGSWNRGHLAKFVYVAEENGSFVFKVSTNVPETTSEPEVTEGGTTIATAEAGKWYTLKLNFNIDGDATTVDTFTYELTDGTNNYEGNGGAVGNKVGSKAITEPEAAKYELTSLYKLTFGYVWDETPATDVTPDSIYLDDIMIKRTYAATYTSSIVDEATDVAVNSNIVLTFNREMNDSNLDKIVVYEGDIEDNAICQTTKNYNADNKTITITPVSTFKYGRNYTVVVSNQITDIDGINIDKSQFSFTTKTIPTDGVTIGAPSITGTVVAGGNVTGSATFTKNTFASAEKLTFMAVAYDAIGTKVGIGYIVDDFADSDTVTLDFNFEIPTSAAEGEGEIKLMVWDSFKTMKPVSEVWPSIN